MTNIIFFTILAFHQITTKSFNYEKLVRKSLKQISGGAAITECQEDMSCPRGLCCSTGNICRDPRRYMCI